MVETDIRQADKLLTLIKAAGIEDVEPIWTSLFAKVELSCRLDVRLVLIIGIGSRGQGC